MKDIILSLRPKQWVKNLLIFAALVFAKEATNFYSILKVLAGFFLFSLTIGGCYIINDLLDKEKDKLHPTKCKRPIASGRIPSKLAIIITILIFIFSIPLSFLLETGFGFIVLLYLALITAYSLYLKNIVIIDVLVVSLGFVLRAIAGAMIIKVEISEWLIICTMLLALFLALAKRRYELAKGYLPQRLSLSEYNLTLIDYMLTGIIGATIIAYSLYSFSERTIQKLNTKTIPLTIPFVIYGLFRYLYLVYKKGEGGTPEIDLFKDKPFIINMFLWAIVTIFLIYF